MVLQNRRSKMASEQPLKKKPKIEEVESSDETDFIVSFPPDSGLSSLTTLHLSLPANNISSQFNEELPCRTSECGESANQISASNNIYGYSYHLTNPNISIEPAPNINSDRESVHNWPPETHNQLIPIQGIPEYVTQEHFVDVIESGLDEFQNMLVKQCLCGISDELFQNPFRGYRLLNPCELRSGMLTEWPTSSILNFLSNLQLLFDIYIKQNNRGFICSKILDLCNSILVNEYNLMEQLLSLCDTRNKYINFMCAKVVSSFFIIAKTELNNEWLETLYGFLTLDNVDYIKMNFTLEIIKRVVEWKDADSHVLEENNSSSSSSDKSNLDCSTVPYSDSESFDTSNVKGLIIRNLTIRWQVLISKIRFLIDNNNNVQAQTCIITFLELWENAISVKNNLSVIDTKPFYAHLETFLSLLNNSLPSIIWKQLLSLFNEVLCYGSTLALQSLIPDDTCRLAHFVIRFVKDHALLDSLPFRQSEGYTVSSFVGTIPSIHPSQSNMDKTLLQKMVLLVLKSVALSIKETKSDSSDSSIGSDDSDYNQDMLVIGRSMKDVLKKLDVFLKNNLNFHPETPLSNILVHLFKDQDDYLIESMVCTLDIIVGIPDRCAVYPELFNMLNPSFTFVEFLKVVSHDSSVLLDYLVSNETCFLLYLLRFLKYVRKNWSVFMRCCREASLSNSNEFEGAMQVFVGLYDQIAKLVFRQLFPYNIDPILRLLRGCMNLYEGEEYS